MKAWAIEKYGDNSELKILDIPDPKIEDSDVLIKIKAASLNPVDFKIRSGEVRMAFDVNFPWVVGNDCAGVITQIGPKVSKFKIGDEVYLRPPKERSGTLAEFIAANEKYVSLKPKNLRFEEAASIPLVGLTSYQALIGHGKLQKGQRVFIPAGSGGVGSFAIQLAKCFGAYVISNTSTKNLDLVKSLGADEVIDYKKEDFSQRLSDIDLIFDTLSGDTQNKGFKILKNGGTLVSIVGPPTPEFALDFKLNPFKVFITFLLSLPSKIRAKLNSGHYIFFIMQADSSQLDKIREFIEKGAIRPVIDKIYPFDKANEALAHVEGGHAVGKVVVSIP